MQTVCSTKDAIRPVSRTCARKDNGLAGKSQLRGIHVQGKRI